MITRRQMLKLSAGLSVAGLSMPLAVPAWATNPDKPRYLILIELHGGNDSLNMCIPHNQEGYYAARPSLAIPKDQHIILSPELALNGVMSSLENLWAAGELAIIPGVGYPEPNRSHFRSIEIWDTASNSDEYLSDGWLSESLKQVTLDEHLAAHGIVIGRNPAPLMGEGLKTLVMRNQASFIRESKQLDKILTSTENPTLRHLINVHKDARRGGEVLRMGFESAKKEASKDKGKKSNADRFLVDVQEAAAIIQAGYGAPVIKLALSGFDTHFNQKTQHQKLLKSLAQGIAQLRASLTESGHWDQTLVMTYSEFGRRVGENGSQGTDHGTAATHFMVGGKVAGGIKSVVPSVTDLVDKDLQYHQDFRALYASVTEQWLGLPLSSHYQRYKQIPLLS